jgi:DNA-binding GntR family transcriptional regulator
MGTFVKKPSRVEVQELYELRSWLEGEAGAKAAEVASKSSLSGVKQCCDEMLATIEQHCTTNNKFMANKEQERWIAADLSFHMAVVKACGNLRALKNLSDQHLLSRVWAGNYGLQDTNDAHASYLDHLKIYEAIAARDSVLSRGLLRKHIEDSLISALEGFDRREATMAYVSMDPSSDELEASLRRLEERLGKSSD